MKESAEQRSARLAQIREQVAAGSYETPDKLDLAVERLLQAIVDRPDAAEERGARPKKPK